MYKFILCIFILLSCEKYKNEINHTVSNNVENFKVDYKFRQYVHKINSNNKSTFLYGSITIENKSDSTLSYNLEEYTLSYGLSKKLGKIYYDANHSVLISKEKIKPKETKSYPVYWSFKDHFKINGKDIVINNQ
mgnify:CR=1 FL=1